MRATTATTVTVDSVLLLHPIHHLDDTGPAGACDGCGHITPGMVQTIAVVSHRHVRGYIPPLDGRTGLPIVDPDEATVVTLCDLSGNGCMHAYEGDHRWQCVPFTVEVES